MGHLWLTLLSGFSSIGQPSSTLMVIVASIALLRCLDFSLSLPPLVSAPPSTAARSTRAHRGGPFWSTLGTLSETLLRTLLIVLDRGLRRRRGARGRCISQTIAGSIHSIVVSLEIFADDSSYCRDADQGINRSTAHLPLFLALFSPLCCLSCLSCLSLVCLSPGSPNRTGWTHWIHAEIPIALTFLFVRP